MNDGRAGSRLREKIFSGIASFVTQRALLTVVVAVLVPSAASAVA